MRFQNLLIVGSLSSILLASCKNTSTSNPTSTITPKQSCKNEIRGGYDIGSGSTKIQLSEVKVCDSGEISIEKVYFKDNLPVKYSEDLKKSGKRSVLSHEIIHEGSEAMLQLKDNALTELKKTCGDSCVVNSWRGIMTEAFRNAKNWQEAQTELTKTAEGLIIKRLTQDEEALYGFYPVITLGKFDVRNAVVWDMGGGSTQITAFNADFDPNAFSNKGAKVIKTGLGSGTFWNYLSQNSTIIVNPIEHHFDMVAEGKAHVTHLLDDAISKDTEIKDNFDALFVNKKYYVIGGILSRSMPEIASFTKKGYKAPEFSDVKNVSELIPILNQDIKDNTDILYAKNDDELKSHANVIGVQAANATQMASNILLVDSYMNSPLQIKEIYPIKIDGTDTIMINPKFSDEAYWKTDSVE